MFKAFFQHFIYEQRFTGSKKVIGLKYDDIFISRLCIFVSCRITKTKKKDNVSVTDFINTCTRPRCLIIDLARGK